MKRIRCPKCDSYNSFDETKYEKGQSLVFVCEECKKEFSIRIGKTSLKSTHKNEIEEKEDEFASILVIGNVFGYKQQLELEKGENIIGRRCKGTEITTAIETADRSMDRRHCIITIRKNKKGKWNCTLKDNNSITGTFLFNRLLEEKELAILNDGDVVSIGATTFIFQFTPPKD